MQGRHLRLYDRAFGSDPAFWRSASPYHHLAGASAPMLLVCSTHRADPCRQARRFAEGASGLGGRAEVLAVAMTDAEINAQLGLPGTCTTAVERFIQPLATR